MDAAERALSVADLGGDVNVHDCAEQIRQAEQAARQDERRKVARFVETFDLDGLEQDIASDIRALADEVM